MYIVFQKKLTRQPLTFRRSNIRCCNWTMVMSTAVDTLESDHTTKVPFSGQSVTEKSLNFAYLLLIALHSTGMAESQWNID